MITSEDFDLLVYRKPKLKDKRPLIDKIIGIDSEAYSDGIPFMFCTSLGETLTPDQLPHVLFEPRYTQANFVVWNMKYDSGALLYHLPFDDLKELWRYNDVKSGDYRYQYIPHKRLKISIGRKYIQFWDISQFFKKGPRILSLDEASELYLNKNKKDINTKKFTRKYVKRFWKSISKYCIQDAVLTGELGIYLINKLVTFGIFAPSLFSCASIAFRYYCDNARPMVTVWKYWYDDPKVIKMAMDAYAGGKFEVTTRGRFEGVEYDITSAYPYEIMNLVNINTAWVKHTEEYQPDAIYGFIRCKVFNPTGKHLPCGVKLKNGIQIYPAGEYFLTITKAEYDYLLSIGISVRIIDATWLFVKRRNRPYRNATKELFSIKSKYKGKDDMLTQIAKICMNSFYGKCVQVIKHPRTGRHHAGMGFNPVYGAVITANTRLAVTRIQNQLGDKCLAVHTDSVMCTTDIPSDLIQDKIGGFEKVVDGKGILIACGMYQIGDQNAFKGFRAKKGESWESILSRYPNKSVISRKQLHVESWVEAMAKNHKRSDINVFNYKQPKDVDLNCDIKRLWSKKLKGKNLLERKYNSTPRIHVELKKPKFWTY